MEKTRRVLAWIGIIILAGLYLSTIICALIGTGYSLKLLKAGILCTLGFPFLLYGYQLIYRVLKGRGVPGQDVPSKEPNLENTSNKKEPKSH